MDKKKKDKINANVMQVIFVMLKMRVRLTLTENQIQIQIHWGNTNQWDVMWCKDAEHSMQAKKSRDVIVDAIGMHKMNESIALFNVRASRYDRTTTSLLVDSSWKSNHLIHEQEQKQIKTFDYKTRW